MKIIETHIVPAIAEKIRLQEYAVSIFKVISTRSGIKKAIKRGEILLNGKPALTSDWIAEGQKIDLLQPKENNKKIFKLKLEILFEDEDLAIINKPAGIPTSGNYFKTVENALPFNLKIPKNDSALPAPLPVHRLDNPTSGLLICAKTRQALNMMQHKFQEREVQKIYLAMVTGKTPEKVIFTDGIEGKCAKTAVERLEIFSSEDKFFSLLKVYPHTGRTHQIRIHLSQNRFPIVGDKQYGGSNFAKFKGLFLTAIGLEFNHPVRDKQLKFELPYPNKFLKLKSLFLTP
ncbi:RluA family pseudouridine synthase [Autumnicola musiva]|uniref:RluA family pseudouridine synthase n=1 Tax=Autumnicola musiva TaxID=3075589 RepID=A0ABU3D2B3_9FLAO|nr:RluA family pseudouridine synthase [Zunongwangia sp. F117]MDT0675153.1 RluA family pseudouridine synthase [Zunongwangia sp. F117]